MLPPSTPQKQEGVCESGEKGHPKALPLTDLLRGPQDHETVQPKVLAGGLPVDRLHGTGHHTCGALLRTLLPGGLLVDLFPSQLLPREYCTDGDDDDDSPLLKILKQFRSLSALRDSIANAGSFIIV